MSQPTAIASFVTDTHRKINALVLDLSVHIARHQLHALGHNAPATSTATNINSAWRANLANAIDHLRHQLALLSALPTLTNDSLLLAKQLSDHLRNALSNHYSVLPPGSAGGPDDHNHDESGSISHSAVLQRNAADPEAARLFSEFETLTWFLLGKSAATAYTQLMQSMLDQTLAVQREAAYWRDLHPGWYFAMSMPTRFVGVFKSRHPLRSFLVWNPKTLVDQLAALQVLGTSGNTSLLRVPAHIAAQEVQAHIKALSSAQRVFAGQLGKLYDAVMHEDANEFTLAASSLLASDRDNLPLTQLKVHVSTLVDTMHQVQRRTLTLAVTGSSASSSSPSSTGSGSGSGSDSDSDSEDDRPLLSALTTTSLLPSASRTFTQLIGIASHLPTPQLTTQSILARHARPSRLTRYWLPLSLTLTATTLAAQQVQLNLPTLQSAFVAALAFARNAITDWLVTPLVGMYETIRHREHRLAIMGARSLAADLASLERMVVEYARTNARAGDPVSHEDLEALRVAVRQGDLGLVLRDYELGVQSPLRSALMGPLLTLMLIQVQKTKVDLELAMAALDKLLKANELNFGLLAVVPAVCVAWWTARKVREVVGARASGGVRRARARFVKGLWVVEKVVAAAGGAGAVDAGDEADASIKLARSVSGGAGAVRRRVVGRKGSVNARTEAHVKLGLTLIEVNYLKHLVSKMGLSSEMQHMLLSDLRDVEQAPAAGPEVGVALERIHRLVVRYNLASA